MKAHLLYRDGDFDVEQPLPPNHEDLVQDLELETLFAAMANGDTFLFDVARTAVLCGLTDPDAIGYRQDVLRDCLDHPDVVRQMYDLAVQAITEEKKHYFGIFYTRSPDAILHRSVEVLDGFLDILLKLRQLAEENVAQVRSDGFRTMFAMLSRELDDAYFETVKEHLRQLRFKQGVLSSAELGLGVKGVRYVLRKPFRQTWRDRLTIVDRDSFSFQIPDRDEAGARALEELRGRGVNLVANALAQSTDHILSFFTMLRVELGFYVGCVNLRDQLQARGEPICFPTPSPSGTPHLSCEGLYDVCLSLTLTHRRTVGNDVAADGRSLVMVTGANQGGKSTFLRSVGLAQLMTQCGMFVGATAFRADLRDGVFTHFKREEDATMRSGKLDEELRRASAIADHIHPNSLLLFNESFAATNEREGSEIARQIVRAMLEAGVKVVFVTHMFDLARSFHDKARDTDLFLRAERRSDGTRTFRMVEGEPLPTSHGADLYRRIFGRTPQPEQTVRHG